MGLTQIPQALALIQPLSRYPTPPNNPGIKNERRPLGMRPVGSTRLVSAATSRQGVVSWGLLFKGNYDFVVINKPLISFACLPFWVSILFPFNQPEAITLGLSLAEVLFLRAPPKILVLGVPHLSSVMYA